jgi:putative transposase
MTNHVHLIAVPESLSILLRRVHGRYALYHNTRSGRAGHLWQNRFFACVLGHDHLWPALAYVDRNPVRAGIVQSPAGYRWSSTAAHVSGIDASGLLDMAWWRREAQGIDWAVTLSDEAPETAASLRRCTYAGRPFGSDDFVSQMSQQFGRYWNRGRPKKHRTAPLRTAGPERQLTFFAD